MKKSRKNYPIATVVAVHQMLVNMAKLTNCDYSITSPIFDHFANEIKAVLPHKYYAVRYIEKYDYPEIGIFDDELSRDDWLSQIIDEDDCNGTATYKDFMRHLACSDFESIFCYHLVEDYIIFTLDSKPELKAMI